MTFDRDAAATDALLTDLYLDALLAGAVLDAAGSGAPATAVELDPAARRAADRLRHDLVRVHPSFRFEERLATRLAEAAVAMRVPLAAGDRRIVRFRSSRAAAAAELPSTRVERAPADELTSAAAELAPAAAWQDPDDPDVDPDAARRGPGRPLIIGGALTSAAISIAGAAFVAWRFGRPGRAATPMARAARAIRSGTAGRQPLRGPRRSSATPSARGID